MMKKFIRLCVPPIFIKIYKKLLKLKNDNKNKTDYGNFNKNNICLSPWSKYSVFKSIKGNTYETDTIAEIFQESKEYSVKICHERLDILKLNNAIVYDSSDIVLTSNREIIWDKYYNNIFNKIIPLDINYISCDKQHHILNYYNYEKSITIKGDCISLLGVHASHWGHFIMQYLPKLVFAKHAGVFSNKITILIPNTEDTHITSLIEILLKDCDVDILMADKKINYICECLYHIPSGTRIGNHLKYIIPQDFVMPKVTLEALNEIARTTKLNNKMPMYEKIYLVRHGSIRILENYLEIENYFKKIGFKLLEAHKLTIEEKICIFSNARIIVGPLASSMFNIIWCKPQTKLLILSSLARTIEPTIPTISNYFKMKTLVVAGKDSSNNDTHTSFWIPLDKIKKAYQKLSLEN